MCPCSGAARPGNVLLSSLLPCPGSRERALGEDVRCDKTGSSLAGDVLESTLRRGGGGVAKEEGESSQCASLWN